MGELGGTVFHVWNDAVVVSGYWLMNIAGCLDLTNVDCLELIWNNDQKSTDYIIINTKPLVSSLYHNKCIVIWFDNLFRWSHDCLCCLCVVCPWPSVRCDMWPSWIITDKYLKQSISTGEIYSMMCVEWSLIILILVWRKSIYFWRRCMQKTIIFYIFVSSAHWSLDFKFAPVVTHVHRYVSTVLEVSVAFLFWENRKHGMDRWCATLRVAPYGEPQSQLTVSISSTAWHWLT